MYQLNNLLSWLRNKIGYGIGGIANFIMGQKGPVWLNVDQPWIMYNTIPEFKTVVDRKATMFSNMRILLVDKDDKVVDDPKLKQLLDNPNCLQGQNDFLKEYSIQKTVYGSQFIRKNAVSLATYPLSLFNLSARYLKPIVTGKFWDQLEVKGIISGYLYTEAGHTHTFPPEEILYSKLHDLDNPIIGCSPVASLQYPLSNIKLAYEFRNVIMGEKGAIGMLTQDKPQNDGDGIIPLDPKERERIEKHYTNRYGIGPGQSRILVTEASMKWQAMTFPTKDMMLFEEIDANKRALCDMLGMSQNIFSSLNGTTYENLKNSLVMVYQDTIQPEADVFLQSLGKFIGVRTDQGFRLKASYEHISILKENKLKGMSAIKEMIAAFTEAIESGILDPQQASNILAQELGVASFTYKAPAAPTPDQGGAN